MKKNLTAVKAHQNKLRDCTLCPDMTGPVVICKPVLTDILLIGQAPGPKEGALGRPFAWTAGKTLFKWFEKIGLNEEQFREKVYMTAVCRCFPGKNPKGGDRVPSPEEIHNCSKWLNREIELLQPELILLVGKLAIQQFLDCKKLTEVVGKQIKAEYKGMPTTYIPLPHPSGASTWHRMEPGKTLLEDALKLVAKHKAWKRALD